MSDKKRYPREDAIKVAKVVCDALKEVTEQDRLVVAGSLRRRKKSVGDVEILFVPKFGQGIKADLFSEAPIVSLADLALEKLLELGIVAKRPNIRGSFAWGPSNKLGVHVESGIPIDFFTTTGEAFFNYLVCRTGGAENNKAIAMAAQSRGWKWKPYSNGFQKIDFYGNELEEFSEPMTSERAVYEFLGLEYKEPWQRL